VILSPLELLENRVQGYPARGLGRWDRRLRMVRATRPGAPPRSAPL